MPSSIPIMTSLQEKLEPDVFTSLKKAQRAWIAYRDAKVLVPLRSVVRRHHPLGDPLVLHARRNRPPHRRSGRRAGPGQLKTRTVRQAPCWQDRARAHAIVWTRLQSGYPAPISDIDNHECRPFYAASSVSPPEPFSAMLVCQCNMITSKEIEDIVLSLLQADPWQLVVPAKVYKELERRAKCSGCVPNVVDIIVRVTENYHIQQARTPGELIDVQTRLAALKQQKIGGRRERRSTGNRAA